MPLMTIEQRLAEAEAAYHDLMTGRQVRVFVDQSGERVEYSLSAKGELLNYIRSLQALIDAKNYRPRLPGGCYTVSI